MKNSNIIIWLLGTGLIVLLCILLSGYFTDLRILFLDGGVLVCVYSLFIYVYGSLYYDKEEFARDVPAAGICIPALWLYSALALAGIAAGYFAAISFSWQTFYQLCFLLLMIAGLLLGKASTERLHQVADNSQLLQQSIDLTYEPGIEYMMVSVYLPENYSDSMSDDELLKGLLAEGYRIEKSTTVVTASNMREGTTLMVVYTGFNSQGQHGPVYRHQLQTHVQADEPKAVVTSCKCSDTEFLYEIEMDADKAQSYYLFAEISNNWEPMHTAAFGMLWRQAIAATPTKGLYSTGNTFTKQRPNGEKQLFVATWALDNNSQLSGYIFDDLYSTSEPASARSLMEAYPIGRKNIVAYNKDKLMTAIKNINYKIIQPE